MGQYWIPVNLTRREFVQPHKLGSGLKLWEQLAAHPGTGAALVILTAAMPEARGGGDFDLEENWHGPERTFPEHNSSPGPMPEAYAAVAKRTIGRWAGDRIALVGDYAEKDDLGPNDNADLIYGLCCSQGEIAETLSSMRRCLGDAAYRQSRESIQEKLTRLERAGLFTDIGDDVARVIEHELNGRFVGDGWREFKYNDRS